MSRWIAVTTLLILTGTVVPIFAIAQESEQIPADIAQDALKAEELGVSLDRIKHKLDNLPATDEARSLLRLNFYIEVYARAPQRDYFRGYDLLNSPIRSGAPMHTEMLRAMNTANQELLPYVVNILGWSWK